MRTHPNVQYEDVRSELLNGPPSEVSPLEQMLAGMYEMHDQVKLRDAQILGLRLALSRIEHLIYHHGPAAPLQMLAICRDALAPWDADSALYDEANGHATPVR